MENGGLARRLTHLFYHGQLDLSARPGAPKPGWDSMPEVAMANQLRAAQASEVEVRLYITFTSALDRARDADLLWRRSADLFADARWAFHPHEASARPLVELQDVLRRHGVSQRHSPDSNGWRTIAQTLSNPALAPRAHSAIFEGHGEARALLNELASHRGGSPLFPFLRGPKIGPMWVRMLSYPGGAAIASLDTIPVAVDVQVRKVTEYLGVTDTNDLDLDKARALIQARWSEDVRSSGAEGPIPLAGTAAALDPALWFYAKWGCTWCERKSTKIPISELCNTCQIERIRFGRPTDTAV
jgi:hypothetical protein